MQQTNTLATLNSVRLRMRGKSPREIVGIKQVCAFAARAWFFAVENECGGCGPWATAARLRQRLASDWHSQESLFLTLKRHMNGQCLPSDRVTSKGKEGIALTVGRLFPTTLDALHLPLWPALILKSPTLENLKTFAEACHPEVRRQYQAVNGLSRQDCAQYLFNLIGNEISLDPSDHTSALQHLSIQIVMLRLEWVRYSPHLLAGVSRNIVLTLGPIARSPWFSPFWEDFFDFVEKDVWADLVNHPAQTSLVGGWRRTENRWLRASSAGA